jgi:hypothetical protein
VWDNELSNVERDSIISWVEEMCNPQEYNFYDDSTGKTKKVITTLLANLNLDDKHFINFAYDEVLKKLRSKYSNMETIVRTHQEVKA